MHKYCTIPDPGLDSFKEPNMVTIKDTATIASISELRTESEKILKELKDHRVILARHNKPIAVMLDYTRYEVFEKMIELAEDYILGSLAHERDQHSKKSDFVDIEEW